ncbi:hypothetical protein ACIPSE_45215 [Streptomyces sp. NPDC090106]|uniref:hypothetical protein n=1 Tax=Streptomyces sp. NPDC090106 TaxID=3365946 RepID=UPI00380F07C4
MTRKAAAMSVLAASILAVAGCSSSSSDSDKGNGSHKATTDAVLKTAGAYQSAANSLDWHTACDLSTPRLRHGSVADCVERNTPEDAPAANPTSPSPSYSPPTYADGSTPDPIASSSPSGPDRATTGTVSASGVVQVPAAGDHPAGYGVLITYTVQWPGKDATTTRRALRLVDEGGRWLVDQHEDVQAGDTGHGSPVRTALSGG